MDALRQLFFTTASTYCEHALKIEKHYEEIASAYSHQHRAYHNLAHLQNLVEEIDAVKSQITAWDAVIFAIFYHDLVYNVLHSDNEEKSAIRAASRLMDMDFPREKILKCADLINATKGHVRDEDHDINLFTDADLSILGKPVLEYEAYYLGIRKEYHWYPDLIYNPGRRKVLQNFLRRERIFKTDFFHQKYEVHARANLTRELDLLSGKA
jgi:predicted metal-dependent HD superfamily phosphohydrolase